MKYTIKGVIKDQKGTYLPGINISVYDVQPGSETLLQQEITGEKGDYSLDLKTEGTTVNLLVRASSFKGEQLGESNIHFNAEEQEQIDITVKSPTLPSEFERVKWTLERLLPDGLSSFREKDIPLVLHTGTSGLKPGAGIYMDTLDKASLEYFHYSLELAKENGLPASFFYGISRQLNKKLELSQILEIKEAQTQKLIQKSVQEKLIPKLDDSVLIQLEQLALAEGLLVQQECFGYLRQQKTGVPLEGFTVQAYDLETGGNPRELGGDVSNKKGLFSLVFNTLYSKERLGKSKKQPPHRLSLHISSPEIKEVYEVELKIKYGQKEIGELSIPLPPIGAGTPVKTPLPLPRFMLNNPIVQHKLRQKSDTSTPDGLLRARAIPISEVEAIPTGKDATSPLAYLFDLFEYAKLHLRQDINEEEPAQLSSDEFEALFHQAFNDLFISADMCNKEVRQIRLCIEVLRAHLGERPLPNSEKESKLVMAESEYLETAYRTLLLHLGASFEEMSQLEGAESLSRQKLANRLGIKPERLNDFWIPAEDLTEGLLEQKFGLIDTAKDALSSGAKQGDDLNQIMRWQFEGIQWNTTTDEQGQLHFRLVRGVNAQIVVEAYQDVARTKLLASGLSR